MEKFAGMTEKEILDAIMGEGGQLSGYRPVLEDGEPVLLGSGRSARVYEVEDAQDKSRTYALKIIGMGKQDIPFERFEETAKLQYQLAEQLPYVTRIVEACWTELARDDGARLMLQMVVMERLSNVVERDKFHKAHLCQYELATDAGKWQLAYQIGKALSFAHANNILHRDVKLENIFWDPENSCYKLGDFGLAKYAEGGSAETVIFTDGYGAPEIENRLHDSYGAAADVYSFGVTLYLLFNDLKFPASEGYYANPAQYHDQFVFPAPAHAGEEVTRVLRKMCAYDVSDRYATVRDAVDDLLVARKADAAANDAESADPEDAEAMTYHEDRQNADQDVQQANVQQEAGQQQAAQPERVQQEATQEAPLSREKRKHRVREYFDNLSSRSVAYFAVMAASLALLFWNVQANVSLATDWRFLPLPLMLLFESILMKKREFHVGFGLITAAFAIFSIIALHAVTPSHIIMMVSMIFGMPAIAAAAATGTLAWIALSYAGVAWADIFGKVNLGWVGSAVAIVAVLMYIGGEAWEEREESMD